MDRLVLTLGLAMIALAGYSNGDLHQIWDVVSNPQTTYNTTQNRSTMWVFAGELAFVFILAAIAGSSDAAGGVIVLFLFVIALLWIMKNSRSATELMLKFQGKG